MAIQRFERKAISPMNMYTDMALGGIVTRQEAAYLWDKSLTTIDGACLRGNLKYRKALTGGSILITVFSCVQLWGIPANMDLWECFMGGVETTTADVFATIAMEKGDVEHE